MFVDILYLVAAILFILALQGLSSANTARLGNAYGMCGMLIAIVAIFWNCNFQDLIWPILAMFIGGGIGISISTCVSMTALPQLVAGFHSLIGLCAVFISISTYCAPEIFSLIFAGEISTLSLFEMGFGASIGAITFSGSIVAFGKLQGILKNKNIHQAINAFFGACVLFSIIGFLLTGSALYFGSIICISFIFGITLILPVGGADMPVIVSMLNSYSGWAAAGIGFTLNNDLLIITGALVGSSGAILSYIMCKGMNRSLISVIFGSVDSGALCSKTSQTGTVKRGAAEDAAFILKNAKSVIIVPGYGMATAQAQHSLREMSDLLKREGISVKYAIHPVAGRMPGHMNVLLAEANVPYDEVFELDEINNDFSACDVAYVIGANDVTNPAAKNDPQSPIYGMPILEVQKAKVVLFVKRSMGAGYAGIDNELFYSQNTMMLFGDAKEMTEKIIKNLA